MLEKNIEKKLKDEIKKLGGLCYKFVSPGNSGVPDRIVMINGHTIFIELKTEKGVLSKLQRLQIKKLKNAGQNVKVLYGLKDVEKFLDELAGDSF